MEIARLLCEGGADLDLQDKVLTYVYIPTCTVVFEPIIMQKRKSVLDVARIYSPTVHEILVTAKPNLDSLKKHAVSDV